MGSFTRCLALFASLLLAGPVQALSCLPHDVAQTYREIVASETRYAMVIGRLRYDAEAVPVTDWNNQQRTPEETRIGARLEGLSATGDGFTRDFARDISLVLRCYGPWCSGGPSQRDDLLVFVNVDDAPPSVLLTPCGGHVFSAGEENVSRALSCLEKGPCSALR